MTSNDTSRTTMTIDQIATAAAAVAADARTAGLPAPFSITAQDYGPAAATFLLLAAYHDAPAAIARVQQWADRYGAQVTTRPTVNPGSIQATAEFHRDGLTYEVTAFIRTTDTTDTDDQTEDEYTEDNYAGDDIEDDYADDQAGWDQAA